MSRPLAVYKKKLPSEKSNIISNLTTLAITVFILAAIPLTVFLVTTSREPAGKAQNQSSLNVDFDSDGDGFDDKAELYLGTDAKRACFSTNGAGPSGAWPADLNTVGESENRIDIADVQSFLTPIKRLDTSPGDTGFDKRWDLVPGSAEGEEQINEEDVRFLYSLNPEIFGGKPAFNGPTCLP